MLDRTSFIDNLIYWNGHEIEYTSSFGMGKIAFHMSQAYMEHSLPYNFYLNKKNGKTHLVINSVYLHNGENIMCDTLSKICLLNTVNNET